MKEIFAKVAFTKDNLDAHITFLRNLVEYDLVDLSETDIAQEAEELQTTQYDGGIEDSIVLKKECDIDNFIVIMTSNILPDGIRWFVGNQLIDKDFASRRSSIESHKRKNGKNVIAIGNELIITKFPDMDSYPPDSIFAP